MPDYPGGPGYYSGGATRPWYMNYSNEELMALVDKDPAFAALLPPEIRLGFPNEYFIAHPAEQVLLDAQRRSTFCVGALQSSVTTPGATPGATPGTIDPYVQYLISQARVGDDVAAQELREKYGITEEFRAQSDPSVYKNPAAAVRTPAPPAASVTPPGGDTRSAAAGDRTGSLVFTGPTGVSLREGEKEAPLSPGLAAPITGQPFPLYRSQGNVPFFSSQALERMTPGERTVLGTTVNRAGGRAEDYWEQRRKLFSAPQGGGTRYRARRY